MKHIKPSEKQWEVKNGYSKKVLLTEKELGAEGSHVQLIKIKPGEIAPDHCHKLQTEVFYFLNENGHFVVNGTNYSVKEGEIIVIQPNDIHKVVNDSKNDFIYIAFKINFSENDTCWI